MTALAGRGTATAGREGAAAPPGPAQRTGAGGPVPGVPSERPVWRRWRAPLAVIAVILAGGIVVALLQPAAGTTGYLDPGNPQPDGARALATLLAERGTAVVRAPTVAAAARAAATGSGPARGPVTLLITDPELLTTGQLRALARNPGQPGHRRAGPRGAGRAGPRSHRPAPGTGKVAAAPLPAARRTAGRFR